MEMSLDSRNKAELNSSEDQRASVMTENSICKEVDGQHVFQILPYDSNDVTHTDYKTSEKVVFVQQFMSENAEGSKELHDAVANIEEPVDQLMQHSIGSVTHIIVENNPNQTQIELGKQESTGTNSVYSGSFVEDLRETGIGTFTCQDGGIQRDLPKMNRVTLAQYSVVKKFSPKELEAMGKTKEELLYGRSKRSKIKSETSKVTNIKEKMSNENDKTSYFENKSIDNVKDSMPSDDQKTVHDNQNKQIKPVNRDTKQISTNSMSDTPVCRRSKRVNLGQRKYPVEFELENNFDKKKAKLSSKVQEDSLASNLVNVLKEEKCGSKHVSTESDKAYDKSHSTLDSANVEKENSLEMELDDEIRKWQNIFRCTHYDNKCVIKISPLLQNMIQNKKCIIEIEAEDVLHVGQFHQKESISGLTSYCLVVSNPVSSERSVQTSKLDVGKTTRKHRYRTRSKKLARGHSGIDDPITCTSKYLPKKQNECFMPAEMNQPEMGNENNEKVISVLKQNTKFQKVVDNNNTKDLQHSIENVSQDFLSYIDGDADSENVECDTQSDDEIKERNRSVAVISRKDVSAIDIANSIGCLDTIKEESVDKVDEIRRATKPEVNNTPKKNNRSTSRARKKKMDKPKPVKNYTTRVNEDGIRMFECPVCKYSSKYSQNTVKHMADHTAVRDFVCDQCGVRFKSRSTLIRHMVVHQDARPFSCPLCPTTFKRTKMLGCTICSYTCHDNRIMTTHLNDHFGVRPYQCEICGKTFKRPSNLHFHKKLHLEDFSYPCKLCDRKFKDPSNYKQHLNRHIGFKRHVCEHCGMSFVTSSDMKKHIRGHTGEKPFKCQLCHKQFGDSSSLVRHKGTHSQDYRFECGYCPKSFTRKDLTMTHVKKKHQEKDSIIINKVFVKGNAKNAKLSKYKIVLEQQVLCSKPTVEPKLDFTPTKQWQCPEEVRDKGSPLKIQGSSNEEAPSQNDAQFIGTETSQYL